MNSQEITASNVEYWSKIMFEDPSNVQLNAFSLEEKYRIIEYAYSKIGITSSLSFEDLQYAIMNEDPWDDIFYREMPVNNMAYWMLGFWGSQLFVKSSGQDKWIKPSSQVWYFDGEQDELNYLSYIHILHDMRHTKHEFRQEETYFDETANVFIVNFEYKGKAIHWTIANSYPGWLNNIIFKLYTDLCEEEYRNTGNYYLIGEGQGGYVMFLSDEAEAYLRKLWNFAKLNKQGKMTTLNSIMID